MTLQEEQLNYFLVHVFNHILRIEEESLSKGKYKDLSINEMHVIEAVCNCEKEQMNTMKELSKRLMITASSLTISVKCLEQKGYLIRTKAETDKRKVFVSSTQSGKDAYKEHAKFHHALVKSITGELKEEEMITLNLALGRLDEFFMKPTERRI